MNILDISCWPNSKIFQHFSDFQYFTLSSKDSHKLGLTPPTDIVHHSIESWEPGEENGTWPGGLRRLQRSKKWWEMEAIMFYARQCTSISSVTLNLMLVQFPSVTLYELLVLNSVGYRQKIIGGGWQTDTLSHTHLTLCSRLWWMIWILEISGKF